MVEDRARRMMNFSGKWARLAMACGLSMALAACSVIPEGPKTPAAPPPPPPAPPPATTLPTDTDRHRVALLVPQSGPNAAAGQALANASTMALLDMNASNLRITTYDTSAGAGAAARKALIDGNRMILGPLLGEEAAEVATAARASHVPVISFSNDYTVAGGDVFVMGTIPAQSINRVVRYARGVGAAHFGALVPLGAYGERASSAMVSAVRASGGVLVDMETYGREPGALAAAARRLKAHGAMDAVLVADKAAAAAAAAPLLKAGKPGLRILGTELWNGEALLARTPALRGALYATLSDTHFRQFADRYRGRYGDAPYRISTMGYDGVLLSLRIARDWVPGKPFPTQRLYDRGGFAGTDGIFRFNSNNVIERALEVREVRAVPGSSTANTLPVASPAPARFDD
jgi:ABC-type branched-subunit amino acid transport system substrate-binding protein